MDVNPNLLQQLFDALDARNYLVAVPLFVLGLVWFVRLFLRRVPKVGPWIASDMGGAVFGILGAVAQGVLVSAALPGEHRPSQIIVATVGFLFINQTFFVSLKKLGVDLSVDPVEPKPAGDAGAKVWTQSGLVILLACALSLSACSAAQKAAVEAYFRAVGECSLGSATEQGAALIAELDTATKQPGQIDWKARGTALGFDVLKCALEALANVVQNRLEVAVAKVEMGAMPDAEVAALRDQLARVNLGRHDLEAAR